MVLRSLLPRLAALWLLAMGAASFGQALAQAPPAVPALPDSERRTSYSISATTCACSIGFALFGSGTDVDSWLEVWISGVRYLSTDPIFGWSLSSATGSLATIPRPITNAVLTFNAVQTGTVQIVGAERPRRLSQFSENRGVAARDLNQALTDIIAQNRETWDKINDVTGRGLFSPPGNAMGPLPPPSSCMVGWLNFGADGKTPACLAGGPGSGNVVGPATSIVGDIALWNNATGTLLKDATGFSITSGGPISINPTAATLNSGFNVTQSGPASGSVTGPTTLNLITASYNSTTTGNGLTDFGNWQQAVNAFRVNLTVGGANLGGESLTAATFHTRHTTASACASLCDKVGVIGLGYSNAAETGTGAIVGGAFTGVIDSGSSGNWLTGVEIDAHILGTGTTTIRQGLSILEVGTKQASGEDTAIHIAGANAGGAFKKLLSVYTGGVDTTGDFFFAGNALTVANVFNMANVTVTGNILNFPKALMTGGGVLTMTSANTAALQAWSGAAGSFGQVGVGRTANEGALTVSGTSNLFVTGTVAGDTILTGGTNLWLVGNAAGTAKAGMQITSGGTTLFYSNGVTVAGGINTGQQWFLGPNAAPASGVKLVVNNNTVAVPLGGLTGVTQQIAAADNTLNRLQLIGSGVSGINVINFMSSGNTLASPTATPNSSIVGAFGAAGYGTTGYNTAGGGGITFNTSQLQSDANQGMEIQLLTTPNNTAVQTLAVKIQNSGGVSVGVGAADPGINALLATDLYSNSATFLIRTKTTLTNSAAAQTATLTNGPTAGNPTKWFSIDDNGTTRRIPAW